MTFDLVLEGEYLGHVDSKYWVDSIRLLRTMNRLTIHRFFPFYSKASPYLLGSWL
jgi:hypothetical protein